MIEILVDIINECDEDNSKIDDYIMFSKDEIAKSVALVFKKYYKYHLTRYYKKNFGDINGEKYLFLDIANKKLNSDSTMKSLFSLGELSLIEKETTAAINYFKMCNELFNQNKISLETNLWAKKNYIDVSDEFYDEFDSPKEDDFFILEYVHALFKDLSKEQENIDKVLNARYKGALWIANTAPNYRDTLDKAFHYFQCKKEYKKLYEIAKAAYKKLNNKKYLNEWAKALLLMPMEYNKNCEEKLEILKILIKNVMLIQYAEVTQKLFLESDIDIKLQIISLVDEDLKRIKLNATSFKKYPQIFNLVKYIYNYIKDNKINNFKLKSYELNFTKYLLYGGYQLNNNPELYESHCKLEIIGENDTEVKSALEFLGEILIDNIENLELLKKCPFSNQFLNLKELIDDTNVLFKRLQFDYLKYREFNFYVMVYGIFSAGKSAFINSLLDIDILKEGALPTTNTFSYVSNEKNEILEEEPLNKLPIKEFILDADILDNITLIDTPGFEDSDKNTGELSTENFKLANSFIVLLDATKPLTNSEFQKIKYLKDNAPNCKFMFIANKIDEFDDKDEIDETIDYISSKLKELFNKEIKVYPYSAYLVKDGVGNKYKENIIKHIMELRSKDICKNALEDINNDTENVKCIIEKINNEKSIALKNEIDIYEKSILNIRQMNDFVEKLLEEYKEYFNTQYGMLKDKFDTLISNKVNEIVDEVTNTYIYSISNTEGIYNDVNEEINSKLKEWFKSSYIIEFSKIISVSFNNIKNYVNEKHKMLNHRISEMVRDNPNFSIEFELVYEKKLVDKEFIDQVFNLLNTGLRYELYFDYDERFIRKKTDAFSSFKSWFKTDEEIFNGYRNHIINSNCEIVQSVISYCHKKTSEVEDILEYIFKTYTDSTKAISGIESLNSIIKQDKEGSFKISEKYEIECKYLIYNINIINNYIWKNEKLLEELSCKLKSTKKEKEELGKIFFNKCTKLNFIKEELNIYNNQLKKGIVYVNGQLYKTKS